MLEKLQLGRADASTARSRCSRPTMRDTSMSSYTEQTSQMRRWPCVSEALNDAQQRFRRIDADKRAASAMRLGLNAGVTVETVTWRKLYNTDCLSDSHSAKHEHWLRYVMCAASRCAPRPAPASSRDQPHAAAA